MPLEPRLRGLEASATCSRSTPNFSSFLRFYLFERESRSRGNGRRRGTGSPARGSIPGPRDPIELLETGTTYTQAVTLLRAPRVFPTLTVIKKYFRRRRPPTPPGRGPPIQEEPQSMEAETLPPPPQGLPPGSARQGRPLLGPQSRATDGRGRSSRTLIGGRIKLTVKQVPVDENLVVAFLR